MPDKEDRNYPAECPLQPRKNGDGGNSVGSKAFGSIMLILAVITGLWALMGPTNKSIETMQSKITSVEASIVSQIGDIEAKLAKDDEREREDQGSFASIQEKFREVETRFNALDRRVQSVEEWRVWWNREVLTTNAAQDEKLYRLEMHTYGCAHKPKPLDSSAPVRELGPGGHR